MAGKEILGSNMNYFGRQCPWPAFLPLGVSEAMMREAGYSGMEFHPFRSQVALLFTPLTPDGSRKRIVCLHQGFAPNNLEEIKKHPSKPEAAFSYALVIGEDTSLKALNKVQEGLGKRLPIVLYPRHLQEGQDLSCFPQRTLQVSAGTAEAEMEAMTFEEAQEFMESRNLTGFCVDLDHFRRPGQISNWGSWQEIWEKMVKSRFPIQEIHLAFGRADRGGQKTVLEIWDLLEGTKYTEISLILDAVKDYLKKASHDVRLVVEVPADAWSTLAWIRKQVDNGRTIKGMIEDETFLKGIPKRLVFKKDLVEGHCRLLAALNSRFS